MLEHFATTSGAEFIYAPNLDSAVEALRVADQLDIALSVNYVSLISDRHINLFKLGILNAHGGDLPRYRGNACQAWAILNGESKIGLCIHKMIGGQLDSGDIIARDYLPLDEETYVSDALRWIRNRIPPMMIDAAELLSRDPQFVLARQNESSELPLRTFPRIPEDGRIIWTQSDLQILRLVRASGLPYSGAFATIGNLTIRIWRASESQVSQINSVPGQLTRIEENYFEVSVGDGTRVIKITDCSMDDGSEWRNHIRSMRTRLS